MQLPHIFESVSRKELSRMRFKFCREYPRPDPGVWIFCVSSLIVKIGLVNRLKSIAIFQA